MAKLPVTHMTLYKHGVGYLERRAKLRGEEVELSFRAEEMNDILKSLTAIDWGGGQVLSIDYATPQTREERLSGCSVDLGDDRSMRDLLSSLRGRRVRLRLDQEEQIAGTLLGLDEVAERQALATSLVSLLDENDAQVQTVALGRVLGLEILDERGLRDLCFFLQASLTEEEYRQVTVRLTPGEHDLSVSYVAPAPTWRVSYRLVLDRAPAGSSLASESSHSALLLGWGIFDNHFEEDLENISLSLVAGMPISFVYDLYTPFTPDRPVVQEEARVAAAPVEFAEAKSLDAADYGLLQAEEPMRAMRMAAVPGLPRARRAPTRQDLEAAAPVAALGEDLGELFQYEISTPVTVRRGHSAMVPIVSADVACRKDLLYNGSKMRAHPVATLRLKNQTGLTLERGPLTVLEGGEYVGEAVLSYAVPDGEMTVPYAVELGAKVREESGSSRQVSGLNVRGAYLHIEEWEVRWREYLLSNNTAEELGVLVEHPRTVHYDLFETPGLKEKTDEHLRFEISVPAHSEKALKVQERRLLSRREELRRQSYGGLQHYLRQGLIDQRTHAQIAEILKLWERIDDNEKALKQVEKEREALYKAQQQIQGNMAALSTAGKEGALRARYVDQLEGSEDELVNLGQREAHLKDQIDRLKQEIETRIQALG